MPLFLFEPNRRTSLRVFAAFVGVCLYTLWS